MRDPRGGHGVHIQLDGDGAWPDLANKQYARATEISVAALTGGTVEGRVSVAFRFDTLAGRTTIGEMTLRELHQIWTALVGRYGEPWMRATESQSDKELRKDLAMQELAKQLLAAKLRLGEHPVIDMRAADAEYDKLKRGT